MADPLYYGDYPQIMRDTQGDDLPKFTPETSALVKGTIDYFSVNFYTAYFVRAPEDVPGLTGELKASAPVYYDMAQATEGSFDSLSCIFPLCNSGCSLPPHFTSGANFFPSIACISTAKWLLAPRLSLPTLARHLLTIFVRPSIFPCRPSTTLAASPTRALMVSPLVASPLPHGCSRHLMSSACSSTGCTRGKTGCEGAQAPMHQPPHLGLREQHYMPFFASTNLIACLQALCFMHSASRSTTACIASSAQCVHNMCCACTFPSHLLICCWHF
jgi:hypothetical protein